MLAAIAEFVLSLGALTSWAYLHRPGTLRRERLIAAYQRNPGRSADSG